MGELTIVKLFFVKCYSSIFLYYYQHVRVWLIKLARTKLVKENEPEENMQNFPSTHNTSN
jgi:hypothetical protein